MNWINVNDKHPEINQSVLVFLSNRGFNEVPYMVTKFDRYGFNICNVTHWTALVEPAL